jgi:hypothetical protein
MTRASVFAAIAFLAGRSASSREVKPPLSQRRMLPISRPSRNSTRQTWIPPLPRISGGAESSLVGRRREARMCPERPSWD